MPTLSNAFGSSNIGTVVTPTVSLYQTKMTVTPTTIDSTGFFPFTDLSFSPADQASRDLATAHVPCVMHLMPKSQHTETNAKYFREGRESHPARQSYLNVEGQRNPIIASAFGSGMVDYLWSGDHMGRNRSATDYTVQFKQFESEDEAVKWIGDSDNLTNVAYVVTPRTVKVYWHDSMIKQVVHRLIELVENLGTMQPSLCHIGLGHVETERPYKKGKRRRNDANNNELTNYNIQKPSRLWNAGTMGWKGGRYQANGSIYIPGDYLPYNTLRRAAKYNHILTQIGLEWLERLKVCGLNWTAGDSGKGPLQPGERGANRRDYPEEVAMIQLLLGSMPAYGFTDNPSPADGALDPATIAGGMREYFGFPFVSGHTHLDLGLMPSIKAYQRSGGTNPSVLSNTVEIDFGGGDHGMGTMTAKAAYDDFLRHHLLWCIVLKAFEGKFKVPLQPAVFMYEGGPRPEHVQQRMMMNFRPDRDYGGSTELPQFTLIPSRLAPGEVVTRVPTLMQPAWYTAAQSNNANETPYVNTYLGPRDPVVITDVKTTHFHGDKPETVIEEQYYYASPVITRDSTVQSTYRNFRTVISATVQRPPMYVSGSTILGGLLGFMSHHSAVSGPVYECPLLKPYVVVPEGAERSVHFNNTYDNSTRARTRVDRAIDGQSLEQTTAKVKQGVKDSENPQAKPSRADVNDAAFNDATQDVIFYG